MQTNPKQLKRQQMIMRVLGYYQGLIDGIWGPKCIAAKRSWELGGKFNPAFPNQGLPFADTDTLPAGMKFDRHTRLFTHRELSETLIAQLMESKAKALEPTVPETTVSESPSVPAVIVGSDVVENAIKTTPQQHQHKHQNPSHKQHR